MRDRRNVDDLSIEELERILLVKRRAARLARLRKTGRAEQKAGRDPIEPPAPRPKPPPISTDYRRFEGIGASADYRAVEVEVQRRWPTVRLPEWIAAPLQRFGTGFSQVNWRFVLNGILFCVELAAIVGLVIIAASTWRDQEKISAEAHEMVAPPTPTATPAVTAEPPRAVVLPGGHTPPDARGFSQPASLPVSVRAQAARITPVPVPTRGPEHATRLVIPAIGVDHPVVEGDDWEALKQGVGHTPWSANPGEGGNCLLSAHNDIFGEIFRRLSELALDDEIFVYTGERVYRYLVQETRIVEPTRVEMMEPADRAILTLISSYPYLVDDQRIVVVAELTP